MHSYEQHGQYMSPISYFFSTKQHRTDTFVLVWMCHSLHLCVCEKLHMEKSISSWLCAYLLNQSNKEDCRVRDQRVHVYNRMHDEAIKSLFCYLPLGANLLLQSTDVSHLCLISLQMEWNCFKDTSILEKGAKLFSCSFFCAWGGLGWSICVKSFTQKVTLW